MGKAKKTISTIISVLSIIILVVSVITILYSLFNRSEKEVTFIGNFAVVKVISGSMSPTIEENQYIVIEKVDPNDLKKDDIITFVSSDPLIKGMLNTHRIYAINSDGTFVTKGDNPRTNPSPDTAPVSKENVIGRYTMTLTVIGAILGFISSPTGFITFIIIPMGIIMISSARDLLSALSRKKKLSSAEEEAEAQPLSEEEKIKLMIEKMKESGELDQIVKEMENKEKDK
ncbi:MAG: signal peptidase I [Clostridia bacterium]|nr:signal peptidase I [Clostridia bacterium]